jgi:hypothetical protein
LRLILRVVSFVLPSTATVVAALLCWRRDFVSQSIIGAAVEIAISLYLAIFLNRRSRGLSARLAYAYTGPDRDPGDQDQSDLGGLAAAALCIGGMMWLLVKYW